MIIKHSSFLFKRKTILERSFSRNVWRTTIDILIFAIRFLISALLQSAITFAECKWYPWSRITFPDEDRGAVQVQEMRVQLRGLQGKIAE